MSVNITAPELQSAADQCVKCAVCLPHCPTYAIAPEETESPRGRITLLQGIVHGRLEPTAEVHRHLDNCLNCGRCEQVCPANVPYTRLLDGTRLYMRDHARINAPPVSLMQRLFARLLRSPRALGSIALLSRVTRALGLAPLLGRSAPGRWLRWSKTNPASASIVQSNSALSVDADAWLFTGCLTDAFERDIANSAVEVAAAFELVLKPAPSGLCCGALYQHTGNTAQTNALASHNATVLSGDDKPVVALLTGCGRGLVDGLRLSNTPHAMAVARRATDLFKLLDTATRIPRFTASNDIVGLYMPCSVNKAHAHHLTHVVGHVPGAATHVLGKAHGCCGAAGDHMLTQPERAGQLAAPIADEIAALGLSHVLIPNLGCAWHLRAILAERDLDVVVEHPVQWLARHLVAPEA